MNNQTEQSELTKGASLKVHAARRNFLKVGLAIVFSGCAGLMTGNRISPFLSPVESKVDEDFVLVNGWVIPKHYFQMGAK